MGALWAEFVTTSIILATTLKKQELSRAHTPRANTASDLYPDSSSSMLMMFTYMLQLDYCAHKLKAHDLQSIGVANKIQYIYDTGGPCQAIRSIVKPVFRQF